MMLEMKHYGISQNYTTHNLYGYNDPRPNVPEIKNVIYGSSIGDTLNGTSRGDEIFADDGVDYIYGGYGNDIIHTGGSSQGGSWQQLADDYAYGEYGNDILYGNRAKDYLNGGGQNDTLYGFDGDDWLVGGRGADIMSGGLGADVFAFYSIYEADGDIITDFARYEGDTLGFGTAIAQANPGGFFYHHDVVNGQNGIKFNFVKGYGDAEFRGWVFVNDLSIEIANDMFL